MKKLCKKGKSKFIDESFHKQDRNTEDLFCCNKCLRYSKKKEKLCKPITFKKFTNKKGEV